MSEDPFDTALTRFLSALQGEAAPPPQGGLARFGRTLQGAAGLAAGAWSARRAGPEGFDPARLQEVEGLVRRLGELKGVPMKMGQILGYLEADLPPEFQRLLSVLQTWSQVTPLETVVETLEAALGSRAVPLLATLEPAPVASASIGQVHRAALPDRTPVAVKVRHPGIEAALKADFGGARAGTAFASLVLPGAGRTARDFAREAERVFLEECDYRLEAERQARFGTLFAEHPDLVIPEVHPEWSGEGVLTTTWEDGLDFETFAAQATQGERDRAGVALFELYVGTLYRHGLFHADPHPGNYRFRADGKVVVFDFGCVRAFESETVIAFAALAEAVRREDEAGMRAALLALGGSVPPKTAAFAPVRRLLDGFFGPLKQPGRRRMDARVTIDLRQAMADKLTLARLRLPASLLFLMRLRFGLYSVLSRLGAEAEWSALEQGWARPLLETAEG